jgi:hypothetical protein
VPSTINQSSSSSKIILALSFQRWKLVPSNLEIEVVPSREVMPGLITFVGIVEIVLELRECRRAISEHF